MSLEFWKDLCYDFSRNRGTEQVAEEPTLRSDQQKTDILGLFAGKKEKRVARGGGSLLLAGKISGTF